MVCAIRLSSPKPTYRVNGRNPKWVAVTVREMFDGETPVKIADVARALEMNYGTCKTHLHRTAQMGLLTLVMRKEFLPTDGPGRKLMRW